MPRVRLMPGKQKEFLIQVQRRLNCDLEAVAKVAGVHRRTISDWKREKYLMSLEALHQLSASIGMPTDNLSYKILPDYWSVQKAARKAGLTVAKKYGGPGTPMGRKKGGQRSQQLRRLYPERYKHCVIRKEITEPAENPKLAEFIGIVLGDGGINSNHQVIITLHRYDHKEYASYVAQLIKTLFGIDPAIYHYRSERSKNVVGVTISSASVVNFLVSKGLKKGNKVKNQVGVPKWIQLNPKLSRACLRGLIDTDGCVYKHEHMNHGRNHYNIGLTFTNHSLPLLKFVHQTLQQEGFTAKLQEPKGVFLYRESDVLRYAEIIGFSNTYHAKRLEKIHEEKKKFYQGEVA